MGIPAKIVRGKKQCKLCLLWLTLDCFGSFLDKKKEWVAPKRYLNSRCKTCSSKVSREWHIKNKEYVTKKWKTQKREMLSIIRKAYGGQCNCCGEKNPLFLTIDHIDNDGYKSRPRNKNGNYSAQEFSGMYYRRIIKANFPSNLQLLCWNCNCGKARNNGICPHKR